MFGLLKCFQVSAVSGHRLSVVRLMGGGPKPRRRLTAANAAEMVSDMSKEERTLLIGMLEKRQAKEEAKAAKKAHLKGQQVAPDMTASDITQWVTFGFL